MADLLERVKEAPGVASKGLRIEILVRVTRQISSTSRTPTKEPIRRGISQTTGTTGHCSANPWK